MVEGKKNALLLDRIAKINLNQLGNSEEMEEQLGGRMNNGKYH